MVEAAPAPVYVEPAPVPVVEDTAYWDDVTLHDTDPIDIESETWYEPTPPGMVAPAPLPAAIHEDEPGWDCTTMGNQSCGEDIGGVWHVTRYENGLPVESVPYPGYYPF